MIRRFQVTLPHTSGLARDAVVNTFHAVVADDNEAVGFAALLANFYKDAPFGAVSAVGGYLGPQISRAANACIIKSYDIGAAPNPPRTTTAFTMAALQNASPLPDEIASCLSFMNTSVGSIFPRNRRGRVYLGPFNSAAAETAGNTRHQPTAAFRDDCMKAANTLKDNATTAGLVWVVYSRTLGQSFPVEYAWVNNDWDVVRSRGRRETTRHTMVL